MSDLIVNAVGAERRVTKHFASLSIVAGFALALTAAPVLAQKGPALSPFPSDPFAEAFDLCFDDGIDTIEEDGWVIDEFYEPTPFALSMSASRQVAGAELYFYIQTETYVTTELSFCTYDIYGAAATLDFESIGPDFGLEGGVQYTEGGIYGAWEYAEEDYRLLITALQEGDYFVVKMYSVTTGATAPTGGK